MIKPGEGIRVFDTNIATRGNFFNGVFNTRRDFLEWDPLVTGFAFIVWTKLPPWLVSEYPGFQAMTEKNFKALGGLSDMDLETVAHNNGFANNEFHFPGNLTKQNVEFTITHQELSGSPIKNMYQFWVSGIRDPETGIATYPKLYGLEYSSKNHTAELMYIVTRPDANNIEGNNIEFAAYWTGVFPKRIPLGHLNYTQGTQETVEIEIPFAGSIHLGAKVDAYAKELLAQRYQFESMGMFDPKSEGVFGTIGDFEAPGITGGNG